MCQVVDSSKAVGFDSLLTHRGKANSFPKCQFGPWLSLVERVHRAHEVGGSNPLGPTPDAGICTMACNTSRSGNNLLSGPVSRATSIRKIKQIDATDPALSVSPTHKFTLDIILGPELYFA